MALVGARHRETTAEFATLSAGRAGVEGTISQAVRGFGLRRSRYVGHAKTHLQHVYAAPQQRVMFSYGRPNFCPVSSNADVTGRCVRNCYTAEPCSASGDEFLSIRD